MTLREAGLASLVVCLAFDSAGCGHVGFHDAPEVSDELRAISASDLFREGVAYARRGDMLRAEQYLTASMQRGYDSASAATWLVRVCVASNRYQAAIGHASTYLRNNPADWRLRFVLANIHDALGDVERARVELEMVVRAEPERPLPHYRLGLLYRERLQDDVLSRPHFEKYLQLEPHGSHAAEARAVLAAQTAAVRGPQRIPYPEHFLSTTEAVP